MKILLGSHHFFPSIGGIETVTYLLAREFVRLGHDVRVVTQTAGEGAFPFEVLRQPGAARLFSAVRWCDLFLQNNISLRTLWPIVFLRRPLFIAHHTWIAGAGGEQNFVHALKRFVLRFAKSFTISGPIADSLPVASVRVGNPYDDSVFRIDPSVERTKELIFVGRLVSDKGVDLLIDALALLRNAQLRPQLTIVGEGPDREAVEQKARNSGVVAQVTFAGGHNSAEIARLLNQHRILVVPSRWVEPFGIVALEAIACGCVVVGSAQGGLPEAIGPCGVTFANGDAHALAGKLTNLLNDPARIAALRASAGAHLAQFTAMHVANVYLNEMAAVLG